MGFDNQAGRACLSAGLLLVLVVCWRPMSAEATDGCEPAPTQAGADSSMDAGRVREESLRRLASLGEGATKQFSTAVRLAEVTRTSLFDILDVTTQLVEAGFLGRDLDAARAATLDAMATTDSKQGKILIQELVQAKNQGQLQQALERMLWTHGNGKSLGSVAKDQLAKCFKVAALNHCTSTEAEAHCRGTSRTLLAQLAPEQPAAPGSTSNAPVRRQPRGRIAELRPAPVMELDRDRRVDLVLACRKMAKASLTAPDDAVFASWVSDLPNISRTPDGSFRWTDWVKAKSASGVALQRKFACTYRPQSGSVNISFD